MVEVDGNPLSLQLPQHIWGSQPKHLKTGEYEEWKMTKTKVKPINTTNTFERGAGGSI